MYRAQKEHELSLTGFTGSRCTRGGGGDAVAESGGGRRHGVCRGELSLRSRDSDVDADVEEGGVLCGDDKGVRMY